MSAPSRIPGPAIAAAVLAAVGVLPLVIVAFLVVALGGLDADAGRDWFTVVLLLVPPFLQLFALGWLLFGRGRVPLVVSALVVVAVAVLVVGTASSIGSSVGAGPFILALFPVLAAVVAFTPAVGRWLAAAREERRSRGS
jgi:peptidoglycan/LPS O-acetylase OafA/YrhL